MKWTEPKGAPPSWLNKADEVLTLEPPKVSVDAFIVNCMEACLRLGCDLTQAAGVTANTRNESGNGQSYRCNNLYGWTMTREYAAEYRANYGGKGPPYWCAPGNKAPGATLEDFKGGDAPWVYYRVFESFESSLDQWIRHYVPRPQDPAPYGRYRKCGELFWKDEDWFPELIRMGYKGKRTQNDPKVRAESIADFQSSMKSSTVRWAQARLGLFPDGKWGPLSHALCVTFQSRHGLPATGELDAETLMMLARETSPR